MKQNVGLRCLLTENEILMGQKVLIRGNDSSCGIDQRLHCG